MLRHHRNSPSLQNSSLPSRRDVLKLGIAIGFAGCVPPRGGEIEGTPPPAPGPGAAESIGYRGSVMPPPGGTLKFMPIPSGDPRFQNLPASVKREVRVLGGEPLIYRRGSVEIYVLDSGNELTLDELRRLYNTLNLFKEKHLSSINWIATLFGAAGAPAGTAIPGGITIYTDNAREGSNGARLLLKPIVGGSGEKSLFGYDLEAGIAHEIAHHIHLYSAFMDPVTQSLIDELYAAAVNDARPRASLCNFFGNRCDSIEALLASPPEQALYGASNAREFFATIAGAYFGDTDRYLKEVFYRAAQGFPILLSATPLIMSIFAEGHLLPFFSRNGSTNRIGFEDKSFYVSGGRIVLPGYELQMLNGALSGGTYLDEAELLQSFAAEPRTVAPVLTAEVPVVQESEVPAGLSDQFLPFLKPALPQAFLHQAGYGPLPHELEGPAIYAIYKERIAYLVPCEQSDPGRLDYNLYFYEASGPGYRMRSAKAVSFVSGAPPRNIIFNDDDRTFRIVHGRAFARMEVWPGEV